jgi:hypothetical protein
VSTGNTGFYKGTVKEINGGDIICFEQVISKLTPDFK